MFHDCTSVLKPTNQYPSFARVVCFRLWYRHRSRPSTPPHLVLGFFDFMPSHVNRGHKRPRFESLQQTMDKLNDKLREFPLPGRSIRGSGYDASAILCQVRTSRSSCISRSMMLRCISLAFDKIYSLH